MQLLRAAELSCGCTLLCWLNSGGGLVLVAPADAASSALAHAIALSTRLPELRVARLVLLGGGLLGANRKLLIYRSSTRDVIEEELRIAKLKCQN